MQFFHETPQIDPMTKTRVRGRTVALESTVSPIEFDSIMATFLKNPKVSVTVRAGIAICHLQDQFNKKTGREVAASKIDNLELVVQSLVSTDKNTIIKLFNKEKEIAFHLKQYKDSNKVRVFLASQWGWPF